MTRTIETWIAAGLLLLAGLGVAGAAVLDELPRLEERCSPPAPTGEPAPLTLEDRFRADGPAARRTIEVALEAVGQRMVLVTCGGEAEIVRDASAPRLRIVISS